MRAVVAGAVLATASSAWGQAWTPRAANGSVSLTAQTLHADGHTDGRGRNRHNIDMRANSLTLTLDYGLTDRLALSVGVPYVTSRLSGGVPHAGALVDDGRNHGAITDLDLKIRYKALDGSVVITPFVGAQWPTRRYATLGHAAPGRGLQEYSAGFDVGHDAGWLAPGLFIAGGYGYAAVEQVHDDISIDRSNADMRIAYYLTSRVSFHGASMWQKTHGGLDLPLTPAERIEHAHHHDQMLRANHWRGSAGIAYAVRPSVDVFLAWTTSIESRNSHTFRTLTMGAAWSFDGAKLRRGAHVASAVD